MYDYIIVGSGPSGGNLAYHLNKAGAKCLLLEAGKFFRKETFPRNEADASARIYWGGGIEFDAEARMAFLRARIVGGTSIVNQCLLDRFDDMAFDSWRQQSGVDFFTTEKMAPYYDAVEKHLSLHTFVPSERNRNAVLFSEACEKLGYTWHYLRKGQSDCAFERGNDCIACLNGCHRDSKQSSLVAYVQKAEKEGLEIIPEVMVERIDVNNEWARVFGLKDNKQVEYYSRNLILAGGSFGTTSLLLKSGFKQKLSALGKYFSSHPQWMTFGIFDEPVNSHKGFFQTVASKDPNFRKNGFKLENVFAPPISIAMLFNVIGAKHQNIMRHYTRMACIEVAIRDENSGEISIDKKGKMIVKKPLTDSDKKKRDDGLEAVINILKTSGAKEIIRSPYYFGLHLMGGCVMGTDAAKSVVSPEFNVHGFKNLFIADSSIYPNAPGINPSLTIMALSQKLSQQLTGNQ
ncbi:MAG TPA: GMC family oxidoreductase [Chitinophagales bacterium]|nr:GMC family oxidoreductase [Chitinophagales bacterium]